MYLKKALERNETVLLPRLFLASTYSRLGQQDDAEWEIEQLLILRPNTTLSMLESAAPFENRNQLTAFLDDLRKAGLSE
jgi:Tfp pilus assembly protein PilF